MTSDSLTAEYWIEHLNLQKHPEGGYFKEVYRSTDQIPAEGLPDRFSGSRHISTSIYFLLKEDDFSAFHKILSDEIWHFYTGVAVKIYSINGKGELSELLMGPDPLAYQAYQCTINKENWFAAELINKKSYALMGCTVSPGFSFEDFELGRRSKLIKQFPKHKSLITRLTH